MRLKFSYRIFQFIRRNRYVLPFPCVKLSQDFKNCLDTKDKKYFFLQNQAIKKMNIIPYLKKEF